MLKTKEEIEKHAKLCASHGDVSDCIFDKDTAAYRLWMAAYKEQCEWDVACAETSYEMSLERGYRQDRYSRRT